MSLAGVRYIENCQLSIAGDDHTIELDELQVSVTVIKNSYELADYSIEEVIRGIRLKFSISADYWMGSFDFIDTLIASLSGNTITLKPSASDTYACVVVLDQDEFSILKTTNGRRLHGYSLSFKSKFLLQPSELENFKIRDI